MKMGAFIMGGLLGAAAVVAVQKYRGSMMTMSSTTDSIGKIVEKGMNMVNKNKAGDYKQNYASDGAAASANAKSFKTGNTDLSQVEKIVKQDPSVKQQVDDILSENTQSSSSYQSH